MEGDRELFVGGVHVHIFLKDPHFPLRNPKVTPQPTMLPSIPVVVHARSSSSISSKCSVP